MVSYVRVYPINVDKDRDNLIVRNGSPNNSIDIERLLPKSINDKYECYNIGPNKNMRRELPKKITKLLAKKISNFEDKEFNMKKSIDFIKRKGLPDLLIFDDNSDIFFMECKSPKGGLRHNQIQWICNFDYFDTYLVYKVVWFWKEYVFINQVNYNWRKKLNKWTSERDDLNKGFIEDKITEEDLSLKKDMQNLRK